MLGLERPLASIVLSALLLASCATVAPPATPPGLDAALEVHGTPPGALNDDVTQSNIDQTICVPGWTATVRPSTSYSNGLKAKLLRDQGMPASYARKYELDHFIPLALGGHPRKPENLWLEPWDGEWGARTKDRLEVKLKNLVCKGRLSLQRAQDEIRRNWIAAFKKYVSVEMVSPQLTEPTE